MKVRVTKGIICPKCGMCIEEADIPEVIELYQCGECDELYEDKDEAKECCKEE